MMAKCELGTAIGGITVPTKYPSLDVGMIYIGVVVSIDDLLFSILATRPSFCHYVVILPVGYLMLYTDANEHIYQINLNTNKQAILLDNSRGSATTCGLVYDSTNNEIYFFGVQLMHSRPDGTQLKNIT
ncbi:unnamed protein product [Didymodactylos carnosus]|uniref:Uncharacterized protein n=1 Tax=Didymodactylos carnosus TaxID=1234261 RepID=A0A813YKN9_9BILA|nr:unnamed protein product [Didymodactylos carnosus]CAF1568166.1 unnamed protein product [Didymodactylos carnosus]CAF3671066.1 unnamed protein product [Didymodactylos carnosus]CAF4361782.1 unnamed protein product [Didymodactylos carnosus]